MRKTKITFDVTIESDTTSEAEFNDYVNKLIIKTTKTIRKTELGFWSRTSNYFSKNINIRKDEKEN